MRKSLTRIVLIIGLGAAVFTGNDALGQRRLNRPRTAAVQVNPSQFTVARLHYPGGGDWYWGGSALSNLLTFLRDEAGIPVGAEEVRVKPSDDQLYNYPFIFSTVTAETLPAGAHLIENQCS